MSDREPSRSEPAIEWVTSGAQLRIGLARRGGLDRVALDFPFVGLILGGALEVQLGSRSHLFDPGSVLLLNPGDEGRVRYLTAAPVGICLALDPAMLRQALQSSGASEETSFPSRPVRFPAAVHARLLGWLRAASQGGGDELGAEEATTFVYAQLAQWMVAAGPAPPAFTPAERDARERVHATRKLLSLRYRDAVRLSDLAREVDCSPFHLCRIFRREVGTTIHAYLNQLRLREAARRLLDADRDLMDLALELGYCHHSHLSRAFRKEYGTSPRQWRALVRGGERESVSR